MLTPQKKMFSGWSLTPRRENQKTPVVNSNSSPGIADGYENGGAQAGNESDMEDLAAKVAKLENEVIVILLSLSISISSVFRWATLGVNFRVFYVNSRLRLVPLWTVLSNECFDLL